MTEIVAAVFSWFIFILGLSYTLQADNWVRMTEYAPDQPHRYYPMLLLMVLLGLTVVLVHNVWVWDWPVLITIFGWMVLIKAVLYLLATSVMSKIATTFMRGSLTGWIRGTGLVLAVLGAILVYKTGLGRFY